MAAVPGYVNPFFRLSTGNLPTPKSRVGQRVAQARSPFTQGNQLADIMRPTPPMGQTYHGGMQGQSEMMQNPGAYQPPPQQTEPNLSAMPWQPSPQTPPAQLPTVESGYHSVAGRQDPVLAHLAQAVVLGPHNGGMTMEEAAAKYRAYKFGAPLQHADLGGPYRPQDNAAPLR